MAKIKTLVIEVLSNGYTLERKTSEYGSGEKEVLPPDLKAVLCRLAELLDEKSELPQMLKAACSFTDLIRLSARPMAELAGAGTVAIDATNDIEI